MMISIGIKAPDGVMKYLGLAWIIVAIASYPFAKKIIRD